MPDNLLESIQPNEIVYGYMLNRVIDALMGYRDPNQAVLQVPNNAPMVGGVQIDGNGITFFANGTVVGLPAGTITLQSTVNGQFQSANNWPLCWGYQPVDGTYKTRNRWWFTTDIQLVRRVNLVFSTQPFHVSNQTTAQATTTTVNSTTSAGGSAHNHSVSGQSSGGATSGNSSPVITHTHGINSPGTGGEAIQDTFINTSHSHSVPAESISGATSTSESTHTHTVPGQTITIPSLNLNPPTQIYEAGMAQGCHVFVDGVDRTGVLGGPWGVGSATDVGPLDITQWVNTTGWHEVNISSTSIGGITTTIYTKSILLALP